MSTATAVPRPGSDLARNFLALLFLALLIASVFWILRPFLGALLWAATIVVATWPMREGLARRLGDRPRLATTLLTVGLLLVFMVPLFVTIGTLVSPISQVPTIGSGPNLMTTDFKLPFPKARELGEC